MMKRLLLLVAISSCAAPDKLKMDVEWPSLPIFWSHSYAMDPTTVLITRESFEYWNKTLDRVLLVEIQPDDYFNKHFPSSVSVYKVDVPFSSPLGEADLLKRVAMTSNDRTVVVIYSLFDDLNLSGQRTALRHEVGHVLGMSHSDYSNCLMYYSVPTDSSSPREVCAAELDLLRRTYGLSD